jgi:hypothetical protein
MYRPQVIRSNKKQINLFSDTLTVYNEPLTHLTVLTFHRFIGICSLGGHALAVYEVHAHHENSTLFSLSCAHVQVTSLLHLFPCIRPMPRMTRSQRKFILGVSTITKLFVELINPINLCTFAVKCTGLGLLNYRYFRI